MTTLPPLQLRKGVGAKLSYKELRRNRFLEYQAQIEEQRQGIGRERRQNEIEHALVIQNHWRGKKEKDRVPRLVIKLLKEHEKKQRIEEEHKKLEKLAEARKMWMAKVHMLPESYIKHLLLKLEPNSKYEMRMENGWDGQQKAVFQTLKFFHSLTHCMLQKCTLKGPVSKAFASSIIRQSHLVVLQLVNCEINAKEGAEIMNGLLYCKGLKELSFPCNHLARGQLQKENANGNPVYGENYEAMASISSSLKRFRRLEILNIENNAVGPKAFLNMVPRQIPVDARPKLRVLNITGNRLGLKGMVSLSRTVVTYKEIKQLLIGFNEIGLQGLEAFVEILVQHPSIDTLGLEGNRLPSEASRCIVEILKTNPQITSLDVSRNELGAEGIAAISSSVCYLDKLRKLSFAFNKTEGKETDKIGYLADVANMIKKTRSLRYLDLSHTSLVSLSTSQPIRPK